MRTGSGGAGGGGATAPVPPTGASARGLRRPTALDWLQEIAGVVGPEQTLLAWSRAAQGTSSHGTALSPDQLEVVGQRLLADSADPLLRTAVRSCLVRLHVWRTLESAGGGAR